MPRKPNALLFLIDALRHDVVADPQAMRFLTPTIARIAERGFTERVVANAQSTQFVLPSIFSQTYPLDHGGYNNGIRERPASFVECLQKAGYATKLVGGCNQMGISLSYDRGFETVYSAVDYRHVLDYRIEKTLRYELDLVDRGERTTQEAIDNIVPEIKRVLNVIQECVRQSDKQLWPKRLKLINDQVAKGCPAEMRLLEENPEAVLKKLREVRGVFYWRCLGMKRVPRLQKLLWRIQESLRWRSRRWAVRSRFPLLPLTHFQVLSSDMMPGLCDLVGRQTKPWFVYTHFMDVHDCRAINRPIRFLYRLKYLPRWLKARRLGLTGRKFLYDSAVMYVDEQFRRLIDTLQSTGQLDDTVILVTGDHGSSWARSLRPHQKDLGTRTHSVDIDAALVVAGADRPPSREGLIDSMGVTATLLDALGVAPHESFKGKSAFEPGREAVISENAGRGNADLVRRDLYFTVTTADYKLMAVLRQDRLEPCELYKLAVDPDELDNCIDAPESKPIIDRMLHHLHRERGELLAARGLVRNVA